MAKINDYIRGSTRILMLPFTQPDGITVVDLTGATVYLTLNSSDTPSDDLSVALQKIVTSHVVPAGTPASTGYTVGQNTAALGISWVKIVPSDTQAITPGNYSYDVQATLASGDVINKAKDIFTIKSEITRT
jgi:hypothetical protein